VSEQQSPPPAIAPRDARPTPGTELVVRSDAIDKAAIILMTLDQARAQQIFARLEDEEIRRVSRAMASLGRTEGGRVEQTVNEFLAALGRAGNLIGSAQSTERMLRQILPAQKVADIMRDISGTNGRVWEKLAQLAPEQMAEYLSNESPRTAAIVLAKLPPRHAARVLRLLPDQEEVALRIARSERVRDAVMTDIEETLRRDLITSGGGDAGGQDSASILAQMLDHSEKDFSRAIMAGITERDADAASRVRALMFGFEDLVRIDSTTFGTLIAECAAEKLPIALAGADDTLRDLFLSNMSERAGNMLREEIESMPTPRKRAIDEAQAEIVVLAKRLAEEGRIYILDAAEASDAMQPV
jgi:flagellar motor switch protein FliG